LIKPLKRFSQNYLIDKNIITKIISVIEPKKDDFIIEIGPGQGALTQYLASSTEKIFAVEIDKRVIEQLKEKFENVSFINEDFLEIDLKKFENSNIRLVGNIPYNITSPIIFKIFENCSIIHDAVLMVQFEVAKRMIANVGTKDYGILSVLLKYFADTELCFKVSPNVFYPKPKVYSAVVKIKLKNRSDEIFNKTFIKIVKAAFGNRRKILKNSFANSIFAQLNFEKSKIDLSKRAEQLDLADFIQLTYFVLDKNNI